MQSSPSGKNLALPANSVTKEAVKEETKVEEPAAGATTASPATPKKESTLATATVPQGLNGGDNAYLAGVSFSVMASAVSFGAINQTEFLNIDPYSPILQSGVAFAYLYLIFSYLTTYMMIKTLNGTAQEKESACKTGMLLQTWNLCLVIISTALYGALFTGSLSTPVVAYSLACLIVAIILTFAAILAFNSANRFWGETSNPRPFKSLEFAQKDLAGLLGWTAHFAALNLGFSVGTLNYVTVIFQTADQLNPQYSGTAFAFLLLYFLTSIVVAVFSIMSLVPNADLPVNVSVTITWALALACFVFALIGSGFEESFDFDYRYTQGMAVGGFLCALLTFALGIASYSLIEGNACCAGCRPNANSGNTGAPDPVTQAKVELEIERLALEKAKLEKERAELSQV